MAEVHFIGTLQGASNFPSANLTCKYKIYYGEDWKIVEGKESGQTHVDLPLVSICGIDSLGPNQNYLEPPNRYNIMWLRFLDLHFVTKNVTGWPYLLCEVYHQDMFGRHELYGYSYFNLPTTPGIHQLESITWRPIGNFYDRMMAYFLGVHPHLKTPELALKSNNRFRIQTESMGKVYVEVAVLLRGFEANNVQML